MERLIFIDLETGGPDPRRHPIIQIAAVAVDQQLQPIEAFEAKIRFNKHKANAYSLRKNNYHPGIWAKASRDGKEVAGDFAQFLKRHATYPALSVSGKSFNLAQLVAHNAAFDGPFLTTWFDRLNIYLPARRLMLCTMQLALWNFTLGNNATPQNYQLATLCAHFGVPFHAAVAHEALADVIATVQLFRAIRKVSHPPLTKHTHSENSLKLSFE
jgi:DNA polymerase III epsilon subunit-like protein